MPRRPPSNRVLYSPVKGVSWDKREGKWQAYIQHDKKMIHLGYSKDHNEAVRLRREAEADLQKHKERKDG